MTAVDDGVALASPGAAPAPPSLHADAGFAEFARGQERRLRALVLRRTGDRHLAEDIAQEALARAYAHRHQLHDPEQAAAWLSLTAGRLVIDHVRVRDRAVVVDEVPEGARVGRDTADVVVARDQAMLAMRALQALPGRQGAVLWAVDVEGASYADVAEREGLSEASVRSLLHRARRGLRRGYAELGGSALGVLPLPILLRALRRVRRLARVAATTTPAAVLAAGSLLVAPWAFPAPHLPVTQGTSADPTLARAVSVTPLRPHPVGGAAPRAVVRSGRPAAVGVRGAAHQLAVGPLRSLPSACAASVCTEHRHAFPRRSAVIEIPLPVPVAGQKRVGVAVPNCAQPAPALRSCSLTGQLGSPTTAPQTR